MSMSEIWAWLEANHLIFISLFLPCFSVLTAFFSSQYAVRRTLASARVERVYQATALVSGFRQDWINALRDDIAEHQAICLGSMPELNPNGLSQDRSYRLAELANRILLRVDFRDPDYKALSTALAVDRLRISESCVPAPNTNQIAQSILKREWERLQRDLTSDASAH